ASLSRAAYANGADVSNTRPISGASMPSRRTRPNIVTSMVSPSITARTSTSADRSRDEAVSVAAIAMATPRDMGRICIAISPHKELAESRHDIARLQPASRARLLQRGELGAGGSIRIVVRKVPRDDA